MTRMWPVGARLLAAGLATVLFTGIAAAEPDHPSAVMLRSTGAGWYLTAADDATLYTYDADKDHPGQSTCNDRCAELWPPLLAAPDAAATGAWSIITRHGDKKQWAYKGSPLYTFHLDFPGATGGDGTGRAWHAVFEPIAAPPGLGVGSTVLGRTLTDAKGMTLYAPTDPKDAARVACKEGCVVGDWRPVPAPWIAKSHDDWSPVTRSDGLRQWSFRGQPLYSYGGDNKIGDVTGNERAGWHAVVLEAASGVPAWVTLQNSDLGPVFADSDGKTLYRFFPADLEKLKALVCNDDCIQANWKPVLVEGNAQPVGNWRPVPAAGGTQQWSYKGGLVYKFIPDRRPGDTFGDKFGGMESPWSPILQSTLILSGS